MFEKLYNVTKSDIIYPVGNVDQTPVRSYIFNSDNFERDWRALATDLKMAGIGGRMNLEGQVASPDDGFRGYRGNIVLLSDGEVKRFNELLLSRSRDCIVAINGIEAGSSIHGGGRAAAVDTGGANASSVRGVDCDNLLKFDLLLKTRPEQLTATDRKYIATFPEIIELQAVIRKINEFNVHVAPETAQERYGEEWFRHVAPGLMCAEFLTSLAGAEVDNASFSWNASSGCFIGNFEVDLEKFKLKSEPTSGNHPDTPQYQFSNTDDSKEIPVELIHQARQFTVQQLVKLAVRDANPYYAVKNVFNDALKGRIAVDDSVDANGDLFDLGGRRFISLCSVEKFDIREAEDRLQILKRLCKIDGEVKVFETRGRKPVFCIEATDVILGAIMGVDAYTRHESAKKHGPSTAVLAPESLSLAVREPNRMPD